MIAYYEHIALMPRDSMISGIGMFTEIFFYKLHGNLISDEMELELGGR